MAEDWPKAAIVTELTVLYQELEHYTAQLNQTLSGLYSIQGRINFQLQRLTGGKFDSERS